MVMVAMRPLLLDAVLFAGQNTELPLALSPLCYARG